MAGPGSQLRRTVTTAPSRRRSIFSRWWSRQTAGVTGSLIAHLTLGLLLALIRFVVLPHEPGTVIDGRLQHDELEPIFEPPEEALIAARGNPVESNIPNQAVQLLPEPADLLAGPRHPSKTTGQGQGKQPGGEGGEGGSGGGGFFGVSLAARSVVFVIDRSGSMHGPRFERVQQELDHAINALNESQSFNVLMYNTEVNSIFQHDREGNLQKANRLNQKTARRRVSYTQPQGGTEGALAMRHALGIKPEAILFLTDGEFEINLQEVFRLNKQGTVIHTITLGNGRSAPLLKRLAELTEGSYQHVNIKPPVDPAAQARHAQLQAKARAERRAALAKQQALAKLSPEERYATLMLERIQKLNKRGTRTRALREARVLVQRYPHLPQAKKAGRIIDMIERARGIASDPIKALEARAAQAE